MEKISLQDFLDYHTDTIAEQKCVLLLGPRFGLVQNEAGADEKIHDFVRARLLDFYQKKYPGKFDAAERLDTQFDNLFILRDVPKDKKSEVFELRAQLSRIYRELAAKPPHPMYEQIARLPFKAVIACTPDLFLPDAFRGAGLDPDFFYYSPKGQARPQERPNVPIVYNLFGCATDSESFIVTYEVFFNFVFAMLGNTDEIPKTLKQAMQGADLFVLLGFDLQKWFIPLILRRLNQEKNPMQDEKVNILNQDAHYTRDDEQKLSTTLFVLEEAATPVSVINKLTETLEPRGFLRKGIRLSQQPKTVSLPVQQYISAGDFDGAIRELHRLYDEHGLKKDAINTQSGRFNSVKMAHNTGIITKDEFFTEMTKIMNALNTLAAELDQTVAFLVENG